MEAYNKWFQTETNNLSQLTALIKEAIPMLQQIESLSNEEVWELVRKIGYINHSVFKVRSGMWDKYPDEKLNDEDFQLNKVVYSFKTRALEILVDYYISHHLDISTDVNRSMIILREPLKGIRQITFHTGNDRHIIDKIERDNGEWDGVRQAHHYADDDSYQQQRTQRIAEEYPPNHNNHEQFFDWIEEITISASSSHSKPLLVL